MALVFMDGFDAGDFAQKYTTVNGNVSTRPVTDTRYGQGMGLQIGNIGNQQVIRKDFAPQSKVFLGFAWRSYQGVDNGNWIWFYGDAGVTNHINIRVLGSGVINVYRGSTLLGGTSAPVITFGSWQYIEVSVTIADTGGTVAIRVDGTVVYTFTGDTKNAGTASTIDRIDLYSVATTGTIASNPIYDDLYILNSSGTALNDFIGDVRIQTVVPNGPGSQTDLTPVGSSANWDNVDETPPNTNDYNYSSTVGARDLYALSDVAPGTTAVLAVQVNALITKTDSGARSAKVLLKSGGTVNASPASAVAVGGSTLSYQYGTNPATGAAWTVADIASLEAGVEVA